MSEGAGSVLHTIAGEPLKVDGSDRLVIAADALPLPTGATTEAKLEAVRVLLASLDAKDFSTEATLDAFLTAFNSEDFASQTTLAALLSAFNAEDFASETTLAALKTAFDAEDFATQTTLAAADAKLATIDAVLDSIKDTAGIKKITDELPAGTKEIGAIAQGTKAALVDAWPTVLTDADGNAISTFNDAGVRRIEIAGKVSVIGSFPPPQTTPFAVFGDSPLVVGSADSIFVIPNGETAHIQQLSVGNEDPSKGASVEIIYDDGDERLIARAYVAGFTLLFSFADISESRDGTPLVGNVGGTNLIVLRRLKFSGADIAIDSVIRGYTV